MFQIIFNPKTTKHIYIGLFTIVLTGVLLCLLALGVKTVLVQNHWYHPAPVKQVPTDTQSDANDESQANQAKDDEDDDEASTNASVAAATLTTTMG